MMHKVSRPLLFLYTFIFTLIILFLTLYVTFFALGSYHWLSDLLHTMIFRKIPLMAYVVLIALVVSLIVTGIVFVLQRNEYVEFEKKLKLLAKGAYEDATFHKVNLLPGDLPKSGIDQDIFQIHKNLLEMSEELQVYANRPNLVTSGEAKEDVVKEERQRLARELHDSVSQQLFAASMLLSAVQEDEFSKDLTPALKKQLNTVEIIINDSQAEMRALLLHLRPINLEGKRLKTGIEQLLRELQTKVKIDLSWDVADLSLKSGIEDHLFRIVQELLSNTLRHAKANSLEVYLKRVDNSVLLRLVDDGVGFDPDKTMVGSYGLTNIRERVSGMGGTCKIISFKGKGSSIEIRIPIIEEVKSDD